MKRILTRFIAFLTISNLLLTSNFSVVLAAFDSGDDQFFTPIQEENTDELNQSQSEVEQDLGDYYAVEAPAYEESLPQEEELEQGGLQSSGGDSQDSQSQQQQNPDEPVGSDFSAEFAYESGQQQVYQPPWEDNQIVSNGYNDYQQTADSEPIIDDSSQQNLVNDYQDTQDYSQQAQDEYLSENLDSDQGAVSQLSVQTEDAIETFGEVAGALTDAPSSAFETLKARQLEQQLKSQQDQILALQEVPEENSAPQPQVISEKDKIATLRREFNVPSDIQDAGVEEYIQNRALLAGILIEDKDDGFKEVSILGQCKDTEEPLDVHGIPKVCFDKEQAQKMKQLGSSIAPVVDQGADIFVPLYVEVKKVGELGGGFIAIQDDMEDVATLLKKAGVDDRVKPDCNLVPDLLRFTPGGDLVQRAAGGFCSLAGPDSGFGGYGVTLARLDALKKDVEQNPDGSGSLTEEQEEARRQYVEKLRDLWEQEHKLELTAATAAAGAGAGLVVSGALAASTALGVAGQGAVKALDSYLKKPAGVVVDTVKTASSTVINFVDDYFYLFLENKTKDVVVNGVSDTVKKVIEKGVGKEIPLGIKGALKVVTDPDGWLSKGSNYLNSGLELLGLKSQPGKIVGVGAALYVPVANSSPPLIAGVIDDSKYRITKEVVSELKQNLNLDNMTEEYIKGKLIEKGYPEDDILYSDLYAVVGSLWDPNNTDPEINKSIEDVMTDLLVKEEQVKGVSSDEPLVQEDTKGFDASTFEQLVKQKMVENYLLINGKINSEVVKKIMSTNVLGSTIYKTPLGYKLVTGKQGIVEGKVGKEVYKIEISPVEGLDITVPKTLDTTKGGKFAVPIEIKKGSGQVTSVASHPELDSGSINKGGLIPEAFAQSNEDPEVKVAVISDNGEVLPWAGININFIKVYQNNSFSLLSGWNLITLTSLPEKPLTASQLLKQISQDGGYATTISTLIDGNWKSYIQRGDQVFSADDFLIEVGKAYFVKSLKKSSLTFKGQPLVAPVKLDIKSGWNAIGIPIQSKSYTADDILKALNSSQANADTIAEFDSGLWNTYVLQKSEGFGDNFKIHNNSGYVLKSEKEVGLSP